MPFGYKRYRCQPDVRILHDWLAVVRPEPSGQDVDGNVVNALSTERRRRRGVVDRRRRQVDVERKASLQHGRVPDDQTSEDRIHRNFYSLSGETRKFRTRYEDLIAAHFYGSVKLKHFLITRRWSRIHDPRADHPHKIGNFL